MTFIPAAVRADRIAMGLLAISVVFGLAYLFDDFGLGAPYPFNIVVKAAGIVLLAVIALRLEHPVLALGLAFGALGDVFLAMEPGMLPFGIAAFGLGHLVYIGLFARIRMRDGGRGGWSHVAALALAAYGVVVLSWLQPYFGDLRVAASVYNAIIVVMTILALVGRAPGLALAGALLFLVSDSVLAVRLFTGYLSWAGPVVWVTYYLGQAGIALGLAAQARAASN